MPEVHPCQQCRKAVKLDTDDYVIANKATAKSKDVWVYSHATCWEADDKAGVTPENPAQFLLDALKEMSPATFILLQDGAAKLRAEHGGDDGAPR